MSNTSLCEAFSALTDLSNSATSPKELLDSIFRQIPQFYFLAIDERGAAYICQTESDELLLVSKNRPPVPIEPIFTNDHTCSAIIIAPPYCKVPIMISDKLEALLVFGIGEQTELDSSSLEFLKTVADILAGGIQRIRALGAKEILNNELIAKNLLKETKVMELEQAHEELRTTQQRLVQAAKLESLGRLAGGIAHEFNNLLGGILGYATLLKDEFIENPRVFKQLSIIEDSALRGSDLTRRMLGFAGGSQIECVVLDLNLLIKEAELHIDRLSNDAITVSSELDSRPMLVKGDSTQILQVFINLGINACDAMPDGGNITFKATAYTVDKLHYKYNKKLKPGNYIKVSVCDTGIGIPKELRNKIFDPFFTTKDVGVGTGLGLSMIDGIIKSHSGTIMLFSEETTGTQFDIYLPRYKEEMNESVAI